MFKEWLYLTFFPQEDYRKLLLLRRLLTDFLKAVMEALEVKKLYSNMASLEKIIQNLPPENSTSNFFSRWSQASDDLEFEFDQILNFQ